MAPHKAINFWTSVNPAWQECFLLAWQSFQARSIPVGAALADADGTIVARGRNRWNENSGPQGQLAGSNLAHAEVNALARLSPGDYSDHVLYTTLEPCFLCTAALRHSHVGTVRFAAPDPAWHGIDQLPRLNHNIARRWPLREGPAGGPLQTFAAVLHLVSAVERDIQSTIDSHWPVMPGAVRLARELAGPKADDLRGMPLVSALRAVWTSLIRLSTPGRD
ncbi:nucleoside deaminase [Kibdelosporangium persicum]|nr:nucleoside deaminase [Kibdelosporangium persicum]